MPGWGGILGIFHRDEGPRKKTGHTGLGTPWDSPRKATGSVVEDGSPDCLDCCPCDSVMDEVVEHWSVGPKR